VEEQRLSQLRHDRVAEWVLDMCLRETGPVKSLIEMQPSFSINWGVVSGSAQSFFEWYALWPAPVNDDACFAQAGYGNFQSDDDRYTESYWDAQAEILQQRLIAEFSRFGQPALLNEPLRGKRSMLRFWKQCKPLPLIEQLYWPIMYDSLPEASIRFGDVAELRAGSGHEMYWIGLRADSQMSFDTLLAEIARGWPVERVQLDWSMLGYGCSNRFGGTT
jgi:hypothetical protein